MSQLNLIQLTVTAIYMLFSGSVYYLQSNKSTPRALFFKGGATAMAALLMLSRAWFLKSPAGWLAFCGIAFCMAADVLLQRSFDKGVTAFGIGHIFLIATCLQLARPDIFTLIAFLVLFAGMFLLHRKHLNSLRKRKLPGCLYAFLLSTMTAFALTTVHQQQSESALILGIGALFFYCSDNILIYTLFNKNTDRSYRALLLILYYIAIYLICTSFYLS